MAENRAVVLTGASGFIAKHICVTLLNEGIRVRGTVRNLSRAGEVTDAVRPHLASDKDLKSRLTFAALDLNADEGWDEALQGADALLHTASPFPLEQPDHEDQIVRTAVEGTLRALRAARGAGIRRVVMTSSVAAIVNAQKEPGHSIYDERDWTELSDPGANPYVKSKTLAEQAAWKFVGEEAPDMELTVINPAFVLGPPLDGNMGTSMRVVQRLLRGKDPALPNIGFDCVDVRDIARMHVKALSTPDSAGKRIIGVEGFYWMTDMAEWLAAAHPGRKITTRRAPDWLIKVLALFDGAIRSIVPILGQKRSVSNARARELLGMDFIATKESLLAAADYLVAHDLVD